MVIETMGVAEKLPVKKFISFLKVLFRIFSLVQKLVLENFQLRLLGCFDRFFFFVPACGDVENSESLLKT